MGLNDPHDSLHNDRKRHYKKDGYRKQPPPYAFSEFLQQTRSSIFHSIKCGNTFVPHSRTETSKGNRGKIPDQAGSVCLRNQPLDDGLLRQVDIAATTQKVMRTTATEGSKANPLDANTAAISAPTGTVRYPIFQFPQSLIDPLLQRLRYPTLQSRCNGKDTDPGYTERDKGVPELSMRSMSHGHPT